MTAPVAEKSWAFEYINQPQAASNRDWHQELMFKIVNAMLTLGENPWVVSYSANGDGHGVPNDGINRWNTVDDLVWSSTTSLPHSWIVLRNVDGVEFLIDLDQTDRTRISSFVSFSEGFTGGTGADRPTANDEQNIIDSSTTSDDFWAGQTSSGTYPDGQIHVHQSNDGRATRVFFFYNDIMPAWWALEFLKNPPADVGNSFFAAIHSTNAVNNIDMTSPSNAGTNGIGFEKAAGWDWTEVSITCEGRNSLDSLALAGHLEERSGQQFFMEHGIWGLDAPSRGPRGFRFDIYWAPAPPAQTGDTYPEGESRSWMQAGYFVVPNDGNVNPTS